METRANYAIIGGIVLLATAAIAGFILWLGGSGLNRNVDQYDIVFDGPVSLEEGASVRYIGIKVGEVVSVRVDEEDKAKVRTRIEIDTETPVKVDTKASIELAGITGITFVQLKAGTPTAAALVPQPGQLIPEIQSEKTAIEELFSGGSAVVGEAESAIVRINTVLSDENIQSLSQILTNLEVVSAELARPDGLMKSADKTLIHVSGAARSFEAATSSINTFSDTANIEIAELGEQLDSLVSSVQGVIQTSNSTLEQGSTTLSAATTALDGTTVALEDARRSSQELRVLINRLDRIAREIERNPQQLVVGEAVPYEDPR